MALDKLAFIMSLINNGNGNGGSVDLSNYYTKLQTDQRITSKVAEIVADAPEDFDTLKELSDWINGHEDSAAAMNSAIAANTAAITQKADKSTTYTKAEVNTALAGKVDKESGKGLSTNDFTDADKNKLDSLENYDDTDVKADIGEVSNQAAINKSTLGVSKKNLLQNKGTTTTVNGVVFTVNDDRSITVNGTATSQISYIIGVIPSDLQGKRLTLTGCPSGGNYQTGYALFGIKKSNQNTFIKDVGDGDTTVVPNESCEVYIVVRKGATVSDLTFYPMLRYAEITDNTYESYQPSVQEQIDSLGNHIDTEIAKTAEQSALNRSTLGYQRKNLLLNNCKSITKNGVTATVNDDGSMTFTGSNTIGNAFVIYRNIQTGLDDQYKNNKKFLSNGQYILSGSKSGADIQVRLSENNNSEGRGVSSKNGVETKFIVTSSDNYVWARVFIAGNADFGSEGVTIYPMIRHAEITNDTYEPYKPSVEERLAALEEKFAALEGGGT